MTSSPAPSTILMDVVKHGAVQVDGVAAEVNIDPADYIPRVQVTTCRNVQVLLQLQDMVPVD
jgi:hypothetical protein